MKAKYGVLVLSLLVLAVVLSACVPEIPHATAGRQDCISCHGQNGVRPFPQWHARKQFGNENCFTCHNMKNDSPTARLPLKDANAATKAQTIKDSSSMARDGQ